MLLVICSSSGQAQVRYDVIDIGFPGLQAFAYGTNTVTEVVGSSGSDAFLWDDGTIIPLGHLPGATLTWARDINDLGQITGTSGTHAFLWDNGIMTDLGVLPGDGSSNAFGINDVRQVVGRSIVPWPGIGTEAFIWENGLLTSLGISGNSTATDINNAGLVVGYHFIGDTSRPFLWDDGVVTELGGFGGDVGIAEAINEQNQVVGFANDEEDQYGFLWDSGVLVQLAPLQQGFSSQAYDINDHGTIVGKSISAAAIWEDLVPSDLNSMISPDSNWVLIEAQSINNDGAIVGWGSHNGTLRAFLLVPTGGEMIYPSEGSVLIAGETDTIRWTGGPDRVTIQLSTNYDGGGGNFEDIVVDVWAPDHLYIWDVPDTLLSRKCAISVEDATNPNTYFTSDVFKIKPYQLTRVDANGDYEPYQIVQDAWVFANTEENMWPMDWYSDFDYVNGEDPFTQQPYADEFSSWWVNARPNHFPDWPSFVRTFGVDQCYVTLSLGGILKPNALLFWSLQKSATWRGSCAGFAGGSFVAFDRKDDFVDRFDIQPFGDLRNVILNDDSRRVVNEAWTYQFGSVQRSDALAVRISTANSGLNDVKEMFLNELMDNRRIGIFGIRFEWPPVIAHALNPWKVEKDAVNPAIERIRVYENNYPYSLDIAIEVNTDQNSWSYPYWNLQDESFGLGLSSPSSSYLQDANIPLTPGQSALRGGQMEVFNTSTASIVMVNTSDDSIIVDFQDSLYINNIPLAVENVLITGYPTTPIGYYLPQDTYSVAMSDFADSSMHFAVWSDSSMIMFGRNDADTTHTDLLSIDGGIGAGNPDNATKECNYLALIVGVANQKVFDLQGFSTVQDDSVHFSTINGDDGRFVNEGPAKTYSLNLMIATDTDMTRFEHPGVTLEANSTHLVTPDWTDLAEVTIYVDLGNNGTIDDSMTVGNTVAVEEQSQSSIPSSFSLSQNYPNPFNPATTITYGLPSRSEVTLRVYNLLGEELSTLVDEVQDAGHRTVSWDATSFPTGIYFYRIQTRSLVTGETFTQSGKMSLVK